MASTTAVTSLSGKTTATNGTTVDFTVAKKTVSAVIATSGLITGGIILMQASHDGLLWADIASLDAQDGRTRAWTAPPGAFRYWRANVLADIRGGGTASVTFMEGD